MRSVVQPQCVLIHSGWQGQGIQQLVTRPLSELTSSSKMLSMMLTERDHPRSDDDNPGCIHTVITTAKYDEWVSQCTPDPVREFSLLPRLMKGSGLEKLPTELHLEIFQYLDKIDSCCLGLASPKTYPTYLAIHGTKMALNTRRIGPNPLESAWEVGGKQICKQCGCHRCELHQHIRSWMPRDLEYCAFKQNFGLAACGPANATCYRGKPSKPKRCGRHPLRTTSIHQDDALAGLATLP